MGNIENLDKINIKIYLKKINELKKLICNNCKSYQRQCVYCRLNEFKNLLINIYYRKIKPEDAVIIVEKQYHKDIQKPKEKYYKIYNLNDEIFRTKK
ncbi:hypothetical protein ACFL6H_02975 [Candidatus Latescibacterota bacterium]